MQYYDLNVPVNNSQDIQVPGKFVYYLAGSTVSSLDATIIIKPGQTGNTIPLKPGQWVRLEDGDKTPSSWRVLQQGNVEVITGRILIGDGEFGDINAVGTISAGSVTTNNTDATAIPVRPQKLTAITNLGAVSIGVAQTALVSDPALAQVRFRNTSAIATVAIGPTGITLANGVIVLGPGDAWAENDCPGITWFAISDTAATPVAVMGMKP